MLETSQGVLNLKIRSRDKKVFEGSVKTLTSINDKGVFDVLPDHANFVALLKDYIEVDKGQDSFKRFEFKSGLISVLSNKIDVYIVT